MAEYIEREKAFKLIKEQKEKETGAYSKGRNKGLIIAGSIINNKEVLPTADVVEVVRCKDCKYSEVADNGIIHNKIYCLQPAPIKQIVETEENRFCSYGERRDT